MKKDVVVGLGEIGLPILKLLSKQNNVVGYDIDKKLMNNVKFTKFQDTQTSFLHIAIPVTQKFITNVIALFKKFSPECIVIHSTISPGTTEYLQKKYELISLDSEIYYVSSVPVYVDFYYIILLNIITFIICFLVIILPSSLISNISPTKAVKYQ